jgi:AraC family transcriptional regulator
MELLNDPYFKSGFQIALPGVRADFGEYRREIDCDGIIDPHPTKIHVTSMLLGEPPPIHRGYCIYNGAAGECVDMGRLIFRPAGTSMFMHSAAMKSPSLRCMFDVDYFHRATNLGPEWNANELEACLNIRGTRIRKIMSRIAAEMTRPSFGTEMMIEACATAMMVELARYFDRKIDQRARSRERSAPGKLPGWQLRRIDEYLNDSQGLAPTISNLARICQMSGSHLRRLFKETTGITIHDYVSDQRMKRSKAYLTDTNLSVKEISARLGFSQPTAFSYAFRKSVGTSPQRYRQQCARK